MSTITGLNPSQQEAVLYLDGPCLVLAGAGSGKTRVITQKIAYLINQCGYDARSIVALTFTNKAAKEMVERLSTLVDKKLNKGLTVCTFHALGVRFLRQEAEAAGLKKPTHDVFETSNNSNAYPISLGYDALSRQLEIEKSITDPTTVNLELLNQKLYLDRIMALKPISVEIQSFNYSQSPSDPVVKNANKNLLVIILFGFVGFVGTIGFVIIQHYVRERRNMRSSMPKD